MREIIVGLYLNIKCSRYPANSKKIHEVIEISYISVEGQLREIANMMM